MLSSKKKQVIVVKNLRDLSPKKTILVSRRAGFEDIEEFNPAETVGNASPTVGLSNLDIMLSFS